MPIVRSRSLLRPTAVIVVAVTVAVSALCAPGSASAATEAACAPVVAVLAPGTTETRADADPTQPTGMLGEVGRELERRYGSQVEVVYPSYPAEAFLQSGMTYSTSKAAGDESMTALIARCPNSKFVLGGYSQGAQVGNDVAVDIGADAGPVPAASVLAAAFLANPKLGTPGSKVVGPAIDGQGIAGPDPRGFGALSGRVFDICNPGDKYCNTEVSENSFLASLGRILGNAPADPAASAQAAPRTTGPTTVATPRSGTDTPARQVTSSSAAGELDAATSPAGGDAAAFTDVVTSDYGPADLASALGTVSSIGSAVEKLQSAPPISSSSAAADVAAVKSQARMLTSTFEPVARTQGWMTANPAAREGLRTAAADSPEAVTAGVLDTLDTVNVGEIVSSADAIASAADAVLSGANAATSGSAGAPTATAYSALTGPTSALAGAVAPLSDTPTDQLSTATSVLASIKPVTIINQILGVVSGVTSVNYNAVAANLQSLPGLLLAGDVAEAHRVAGEINNQLSPLVTMAAGVDLAAVAKLIALIPDPSGTAAAVATVAGLLANVDIVRLARAVGQLQEVAWQVAETGNVLALGQLLPIGVEVATVAVGVLNPTSTMSPDQLHAPADSMTALMNTQAQNSDLVGLGNSALATVTSPDGAALTELIDAGVTAASFLGSRVHESYGQWIIDGNRTALNAMVDIYTSAIGG